MHFEKFLIANHVKIYQTRKVTMVWTKPRGLPVYIQASTQWMNILLSYKCCYVLCIIMALEPKPATGWVTLKIFYWCEEQVLDKNYRTLKAHFTNVTAWNSHIYDSTTLPKLPALIILSIFFSISKYN